MSQRPPGSFTQATAPALPISSSTATGKPGRFAASAFRPTTNGPWSAVSVRLAEHDGLIYLDLADEFWRCVEIGANGWRIAENPPVRFRRGAGMQPLPLPVRGGAIEALAPFLNLASENDFVLVVAWLLGALRAGGPYPVLAIAGEQGSAKTVLSKLLRVARVPQ
jgi:hypothetical protein